MTAKKKKPESGSKQHRLRFWLNKEMPDDGTRKDGSSNWPAKLLKKFKKPQKKAVTLPEQHTAPNLSREASTQRDSTLTEAKNRGSAEPIKDEHPKNPSAVTTKENGSRQAEPSKKDPAPPKPQPTAKDQTLREKQKLSKEKFDLPTKSKHEKEKAKDSKDRTSKEKPLEKRDSLRERVKNSVRKFDESLRKRKKRPEKLGSDKESNKNADVDPSKASLKNRHLSKEFKKRKKKASEVEGKEVKEGKSKRNSLRKSFSSFRERQAKNWTLVKTFISRPYKAQSMQKILGKVSKRKEFREKQSTSAENSKAASSSSLLKQGDEMFPTVKRPPPKSPSAPSKQAPIKSVPEGNALHNNIKEKLFKEKPHTVEEKTIEKTKEDSNPNDAKDLKDTKKGCKEECEKKRLKLVKNNDNNGMLFLEDGRPFWQQKGKGIRGRQDVDPEDDLTDDELPMNAEVLLEVHLGKIKLVEMPTQQVTLDPYATLEVLESRDELFFVRNMLFSNTVRSMINLNDDATLSEKKSSQEKAKLTWKEEPTQIGVYDQRKPRNIAAEKRK